MPHRIDLPLVSNSPKADCSFWAGIHRTHAIGGTWTKTRVAANHLVLRKTAADDTTQLIVDVMPPLIRTAASRGFKLKSFDVVYDVDTADLDAHTATCKQMTLANSAAPALAAHGGTLSGTLSVASADADPLVTTLSLGTPAWLNSTLISVTLEIIVDAAATSAYDFYGVNVNYDMNLL